LVLDCQATGANPDKSRLLEVGWTLTSADGQTPATPESYLVRSDGKEEIPRRVKRVTGITADDLASSSALTPEQIWERLATAARNVVRANETETCPTVIHFARFEGPYLNELHRELSPTTAFPFDIICTHEIVKRILPDVPRRGLRAIAGYFGHTVPELRRAVHHVIATAFIWHHLVEKLGETQGVHTLDELRQWIMTTDGSSSTGRTYPMSPVIRFELPDRPGVYRMRRSNGDLLYIGRARSLHRRVNSYFQKRRHHAEHTLEMLTQARQLDVTVTETALEAAVLESDEIKRFSPPYNVALREGDRRVAFSSKDLRKASPEPDEVHRIGPLPSEATLQPFRTVADILEQGHLENLELEEWLPRLGLVPEYAPEMGCFGSGFEMFRQKHAHRWLHCSALQALTALGRDLWRERLNVKEEPPLEEDEKESEKGWTPDKIVTWLENLSLRGAFFIRRSRWLCLLSESSLAWERRGVSEPKKTLAIFSEGTITEREDLRLDVPIPAPPDWGKSPRDRQRSFDITTYDRLIVVTTELRRLLAENRKVELRLSPSSLLQNDQIAKALEWV
jgi:DNA polymerase-3 subunit epsilon